MPNILVVDDEEDIRSLLSAFFHRHGYTVSVATDGDNLFEVLDTQLIDVVVLDVMLPGEDGLSLCRRLRSVSKVPVIMLTAVTDHVDRVVGLEIGADDYLVKPFDARELLARVRALLRRSGYLDMTKTGTQTRPFLSFAGWRLDIARRELRSPENTLTILSSSEFDLLLAFAENPQRVLSRDQLLDIARGSSHDVYDRSIDVQVGRLRRKLDIDDKEPSVIRTVRGGGYMFTPMVRRG
ncbi:response regulator transcription factor [Burkholderia gladioli pv. gladioli]|uniref:Response regulator n=1 Tax=Burkholderia gladioli TaxID=28095 RepID=A0A095F3Z6_BURGA|nr:response regulator transcription factor [Burkholderia gladioli]AJW99018.1 response regulator [Burkholderia gladioli]ASD79959.1 DNA-binding response regulator [Burkholderia gladioli pv. gladioli]AWY56888.1 DNA-binding response regulator [Burkholderia gladioli pv. gladioli]KGC11680.1 response regulator [Burkholderia gladioli]MDJ1164212.1 response regulator transcription factor [Burkholderia gladioli pv. gladioli]